MANPRVFVSHATNDATFANNFSHDLRQLGADVWLDSSHLGAGDFVARINDALQRSDVFILVLTPAALASQWVQQEMNAAITREKQGILRALFVVEAQHCPLGAIPPLWTVYNRYDANRDYSGALYGVAEKLGLRTPSAAARSAPIVSTPKPPTQEAATPVPPSPTSTPFAYTPTPTAPPPVSTPSTPAPWSPYPMSISLPRTSVPEAPGQPALAPTHKKKRPVHRWIFWVSVLATVDGLITLGYELPRHDYYGPTGPSTSFGVAIILPGLLAALFAWVATLLLAIRAHAPKWMFAMVASVVFPFIVTGLLSGGAYNSGKLAIIAVCSLGVFVLPLRAGFKGLGKSPQAAASPPPSYAAAAAPQPAASLAPSWRRPAHRWIYWSAALATTSGTITLGYELVNQTSYYPAPLSPGFGIGVFLPGVLATAFTWISTLLLTVRRQAWRRTFALAVSILVAILSSIGFGQSITHGGYHATYDFIAIAACSLAAFVLPLRIGLVGLLPKREK